MVRIGEAGELFPAEPSAALPRPFSHEVVFTLMDMWHRLIQVDLDQVQHFGHIPVCTESAGVRQPVFDLATHRA